MGVMVQGGGGSKVGTAHAGESDAAGAPAVRTIFPAVHQSTFPSAFIMPSSFSLRARQKAPHLTFD